MCELRALLPALHGDCDKVFPPDELRTLRVSEDERQKAGASGV